MLRSLFVRTLLTGIPHGIPESLGCEAPACTRILGRARPGTLARRIESRPHKAKLADGISDGIVSSVLVK